MKTAAAEADRLAVEVGEVDARRGRSPRARPGRARLARGGPPAPPRGTSKLSQSISSAASSLVEVSARRTSTRGSPRGGSAIVSDVSLGRVVRLEPELEQPLGEVRPASSSSPSHHVASSRPRGRDERRDLLDRRLDSSSRAGCGAPTPCGRRRRTRTRRRRSIRSFGSGGSQSPGSSASSSRLASHRAGD